MLSVLISLLILLAAAWALGRIVNRRMEECVPIVFMGTIVFLYIFYCLNALQIGRYVLYAFIFILVILSVLQRKTKPAAGDVLSPGIVLFLCLCVLLLIFSINLKPSVWDELRLWAALPKALHESGAMQVGEGSLLYSTMQSYPPGMALLIYFLTSFSGEFWYGSCFAAYWIFAAALLLPVMHKFRWKQWYVMPLVFFVFLLMPVILTLNGSGASGDWYYAYVTLFIEPMLGCLLGFAFFQAAKNPFRSVFELTGFSLTLFVLPALKNMGAIYACVVFAAALVIQIVNKKKHKILFYVIPILSAAISYFSWQLIIRTRGTGEFIDLDLSSFTGEKFLNAIKGMTTWGTIPFIFYILFFLACGLLLTFVLKDQDRKTSLICFLGILTAFLIFFYGYVSHYGLMLSSIHRYTSVFTFTCWYYLLLRAIYAVNPKAEMTFSRTRLRMEEEALNEKPAPPAKSVFQTILPNHTIDAAKVLLIEVILMAVAVFFLFNVKNNQLTNNNWQKAETLAAEAESMFPDKSEPARTYLALGGDIRKQSQKHETYALAAIGSPVNIQNIWCDKLFNEAVEGAITDKDDMTRIWADTLLTENYEYVILAEPDEDIVYAVQEILNEQGGQDVSDIMSDISSETQDFLFLKVIPADTVYGISFSEISDNAIS